MCLRGLCLESWDKNMRCVRWPWQPRAIGKETTEVRERRRDDVSPEWPEHKWGFYACHLSFWVSRLLNISGDTGHRRLIVSAAHVCPDSPENNKHQRPLSGHLSKKWQPVLPGTTTVNIPQLVQINIAFQFSGLKAGVRPHTGVFTSKVVHWLTEQGHHLCHHFHWLLATVRSAKFRSKNFDVSRVPECINT